jgi:hypothetical protein
MELHRVKSSASETSRSLHILSYAGRGHRREDTSSGASDGTSVEVFVEQPPPLIINIQ